MIQHRQHHHHHHRNAVHHNQKRSYHIATTTAPNINQPVLNHENVSYYDAQVIYDVHYAHFHPKIQFKKKKKKKNLLLKCQFFFLQYIQQKPKSWDNLAMKAFGGYGFGYDYLDKVNPKNRTNITASGTVRAHFLESDSQILYASQGLTNNRNQCDTLPLTNQQQHNSVPRKNPSGRYSLLNIENYAPPPSQFVQEFSTATTTTTSFAKSTDNLIGTYNNDASNSSINSTDAQNKVIKSHKSQTKDCLGYYSNLPNTTNVIIGKTTAQKSIKSSNDNLKNCESVSTVSEMTRL